MGALRTPVAPRHRSGRRRAAPAPRRAGAGKVALAAAVLVGAMALFGGVGVFAWRALPALPRVEELRSASAAAAISVPPVASHARGTGPSAATGTERGPTPTPGLTRNPDPSGLERVAAAIPPAAPAGEQPARFKLVIIDSAGEINVRSRKVTLAYVDAPSADARCTNDAGRDWPCGARARTALRRLVRARAIDCHDLSPAAPAAAPAADDAFHSLTAPAAVELNPTEPAVTATCEVAGTNLSRWLVEQGWAAPGENAPADFAALNATARRDKRGLYQAAGR